MINTNKLHKTTLYVYIVSKKTRTINNMCRERESSSLHQTLVIRFVSRVRNKVNKKVEKIGIHNSSSHIFLMHCPSLPLQRHRPRPLRQLLDEKLARLREHDRSLTRYHLHFVARFLHDLLDSCQRQRMRPGFPGYPSTQ